MERWCSSVVGNRSRTQEKSEKLGRGGMIGGGGRSQDRNQKQEPAEIQQAGGYVSHLSWRGTIALSYILQRHLTWKFMTVSIYGHKVDPTWAPQEAPSCIIRSHFYPI